MTTTTTTLADFLLARIADDEERAQFVASQVEANNWTPLEQWRLSWHDEYDLLCIEPSRVLAECVAKRRIVEFASEFSGETRYETRYETGRRFALDETLRILAAAYADHPDYREEWRA